MSINGRLTEYLNFYLGEENLGYAVLINGPWGKGKTFYIKSFMKARKQVNPADSQFVYISLNGVKTVEEIEDQIFQQLHPLLGHKHIALAGKALKGLARLSVKYVPAVPAGASDAIDSVVDSASNIRDIIGKSQNAILVFDDLERCKLSVEHVLGMINQFVEHEGHRAIALGNEAEILDANGNPHPKYGEIKEKVFGRTFLIEADTEGALRDFIDNSSNEGVRQILLDNETRILDLYRSSGYDNLRSMKQAINEFAAIYALLPEKAKGRTDLVADVLSSLVVLSLEIRKNSFSLKDLSELSSKSAIEIGEKLTNREPTAREKIGHFEGIQAKYNGFQFSSILPNDMCWFNFFQFGSIPREMIDESISSSSYFIDEHTAEWQKLWHYDFLENDEFETIADLVRHKFDCLEYTCPGVVHHIAGIFLHLSRGKFISESFDDTIKWLNSVADRLLVTGAISQDSPGQFGGYSGLGFHSRETKEFREFAKYYETLQKKALEREFPVIGKEVFDLFKRDPSEFWNRLSFRSKDRARLDKLPILASIDPSDFAHAYLATPNSRKHYVGLAIQERYKDSSSRKELLPELPWLKSIKQTLDDAINEGLGKITKLHASRLKAELAAAIDLLESVSLENHS